jgi:hypothetical protein
MVGGQLVHLLVTDPGHVRMYRSSPSSIRLSVVIQYISWLLLLDFVYFLGICHLFQLLQCLKFLMWRPTGANVSSSFSCCRATPQHRSPLGCAWYQPFFNLVGSVNTKSEESGILQSCKGCCRSCIDALRNLYLLSSMDLTLSRTARHWRRRTSEDFTYKKKSGSLVRYNRIIGVEADNIYKEKR